MKDGLELEVRLGAVEFLLAHLIARTRGADLSADRQELRAIVDRGDAWRLLPEVSRKQAAETIRAAVDLLEAAELQQGSG